MRYFQFTCERCQCFCPFYCQIILIYHYVFISWWTCVFLFTFCAVNLHAIFCVEIVWISLQYTLGGGFRLVKPLRNCQLLPKWLNLFLLPINCSFPSSPKLVYLFCYSYPELVLIVPYCDFYLYFPDG